jgi:quercetin 2,3-dioxygenase
LFRWLESRAFSVKIKGKETPPALAYVMAGKGYFDEERDSFAHEVVGENYFDMGRECLCSSETLILYEDGENVSIMAQDEPLRFLLISGRPLGEPVAWYGPVAMNTQEELKSPVSVLWESPVSRSWHRA